MKGVVGGSANWKEKGSLFSKSLSRGLPKMEAVEIEADGSGFKSPNSSENDLGRGTSSGLL